MSHFYAGLLQGPRGADHLGGRLTVAVPVHLIPGLLASQVSGITSDIEDLAHLLLELRARRYPHRAGRKINTTSSLLAALLEAGWVIGRKRGETRRVCEAAVSRDEGLRQLALRAVEVFRGRPGDGWYLVWAALGALDLGAHGRSFVGRSRASSKASERESRTGTTSWPERSM